MHMTETVLSPASIQYRKCRDRNRQCRHAISRHPPAIRPSPAKEWSRHGSDRVPDISQPTGP